MGQDAGMPQGDVAPDTKDWTWVLERPCPECGFVAVDVDPMALADRVRATTARWQEVLGRADARTRPGSGVWSPAEYGCHVRDVHRTMAGRLRAMLDEDAPTFPNWDQDATAVAERYDQQAPTDIAAGLAAAAEAVAALYESVPAGGWDRPGLRSNGSRDPGACLGRYHLHDVVHHLHDVAG
jgi:hypothetical protein